MAEARRRVALIITGGTIDSVGTDRLDLGWYLEAGKRLDDGELVARVPELAGIAEVTDIPFRRLPSQSITTADWLDLIKTIQDLFASERADGVVITHGTNTLEETAYFLHLVLKTDRPHTTRTVFQPGEITELPRVDVVVSYIGADGTLIDAAVAAGARGIVSAGTGAGRPTPGEIQSYFDTY
jgi:L-asparaginase/Glu-tRNA(Gln) amidotransferase subunit D